MFRRMILTVLVVTGAVSPVAAQGQDPQNILSKTRAAYQGLATYHSDVGLVFDVGTQRQVIKGKITLGRPNLYQISWEQDVGMGPQMGGVTWNSGEGPYFFLPVQKVYSKPQDDVTNLLSLSGVSSSISSFVPSLFFKFSQGDWLSRLLSPQLVRTETVAGELCDVIEGGDQGFDKATLWISKKSGLVLKQQYQFDSKKTMQQVDMSEEQLRATLRQMGQAETEENIQAMRQIMESAKKQLQANPFVGTMTLQYENIIPNAELEPDDVHYALPQDAQYKENPWAVDLNQLRQAQKVMEGIDSKQGTDMSTEILPEQVGAVPLINKE